jgi:hypothetical protein
MAEYFDIDGDDAGFERDPVMILSAVPADAPPAGHHFGRGIDIDLDDHLGLDEDTADTDPLGGINPYVDV